MFDKSAHKIIFSGPVGSGKSTAINAISDVPVISTEQAATDDVKNRKETTTVALDYGMIKLGEGENIHIYG
ncbi:MAG: GTP-binding protein, partial [Gammaproteobacteria bacterium]|nr:GTP-binding protein [Gammaproteobacteria bacterium]